MNHGPRPSTWPGDSDSRGSGVRGFPGSSSGDPGPRAGPGAGPGAGRALPRLPGFPYEVLRQLGQGGMGAVFEVVKPGDPRRLAAKLLTLTSAHARARFEREGQVVARLEHPGVIPVIASGTTENGTPYLIFEFVDGRSLKDVIHDAQQPHDEATVLRWGEELARALGSAHALGIVHRDIKPANVMIDGAGRVRVADFGIALAADLDRLTKTGQLAGTPLYMAPEQFAAHLAIGPWTDVHAVGSVLFEALAGQAPFDAPTAPNVVASILHAEAPSLRSVRRDVSAGLAAVIARCLEKDPSRRYPDGDALADDLARLRRGERVSAVSTFLRAARRRVLRRTTVIGLTLATVVVLPAAGLLFMRRATLERERAEAATKVAADLDSLAAQVRPGASERALGLAERDLARAREALVDLPEGAARARLQEAIDRLEARRATVIGTDRARAVMKAGALDAEALLAALEALEAVPPAVPAAHDVEAWAREEARPWLQFLAGRLEDARASAARLAPASRSPSPAGGDATAGSVDPDAWLAEAGHRAVWLSCWCALRLGDAEALARLARELPAPLRARLAAAEATVAVDPAPARAAAREALAGRTGDPGAALVLAGLAVDELLRAAGPADLGQALDVLARVRSLSAPASPARVPRVVQAQAALLEGDVHLAIGWPASAAEAFTRARRLMVDAGPPFGWPAAALSLPVDGRRRRVLLAPDTAARVGEALARALCPDRDAALAAASGATARAALDHPALAAERVATTTALLTGAAPSADATSPAALQLAGAWPPLVEDLAASAEADLAVAFVRARRQAKATEQGRAPAPGEDPGPPRERARQALRLAATLEGGASSPRVLAGLARAEAAAGDLTAAGAALTRARALAPGAAETLTAAAHVALAEARPDAAAAAGRAAVEALGAQERRLIERGELTTALLLPLLDALERGGHQVDALPLLELASRCAERDRLQVEARAALHERLASAARALGRQELAREAAERRAQLGALVERLNRASRLVAAQTRSGGQLADTPELRQAYALLMGENPQDASTYISNHMSFGRLRGEGFDNLALAFECHADTVVDYLNDPSFALRRMATTEAEAAAASIRLLTDAVPPDASLPVPRDEDLRRALAGLYCADLRISLEPSQLAPCLRAARAAWGRRPMSEPASLVLGRLLIVAGAAADALPHLGRTQDQMALALPDRVHGGCWRPLYEALAWAALGDPARARAALAEARDRRLSLSHRIREEPLFWEDQALPGTLYPWAAEVAKEIEATYGAR